MDGLKTLGVIVPFFNEEKYLMESVKRLIDINLLNQIILVDDCSTDNGLIKEYFLSLKSEFKDIKIFYFSENLGYVQSVNCILSNASGDKIIFVSNDIVIAAGEVESVSAMPPETGISFAWLELNDGEVILHLVNHEV